MTSEFKPLEEATPAQFDLGWKARTQKELALRGDLLPLLKKRAGGREIAGLKAYEE